MPLYIGRAEAVRLFAADDPGVDESHIFQGDVFHSVEFRVPGKPETVLGQGIVASHDCEYTKAKGRPHELPLLVAPVRELRSFPGDQATLIRRNRLRNALFLPHEPPLDDEYMADLRLLQPILTFDLQNYQYITSASPELKRRLQAKLTEFLTRRLFEA